MTAPLRAACVGLGYFSQFHLDAWTRIEGARLAAVCSRDIAKAQEAAARHIGPGGAPAAFNDLGKLLADADPDILDIITPPETHAESIIKALRPGRTIICQKPFCRNLAEAREAMAQAEAANVTLVVHENFRFQPWHRAAKAILDSGALGEIYQATFRLRPGDGQGPDAYLARQPFFREMPRFLLHETAIHFVDTFRFLLGEVDEVYAEFRQLNPVIKGEDAGLIMMSHRSGARSVFDGNRLSDHIAGNRRKTMGEMLIEGSLGTLRLDGDGRLWRRDFGANQEAPAPFDYEDRGFGGDCVTALQAHVVRHLQGGAALENDARAYLRNIEIEEAAYLAADTGAKQRLTPRAETAP